MAEEEEEDLVHRLALGFFRVGRSGSPVSVVWLALSGFGDLCPVVVRSLA